MLDLPHPHNCTICEVGMRDSISEMRKLKLSGMKRNSLKIPRFTEQNQGSEAGWPDSKVLSSTTLRIRSRNLPQGGQGRGAHVEGRLVIKARKIHDLLGNYLTDHSLHVVSQQWNWGSGINSPTSLSTPPRHLFSSAANPGRCTTSQPPAM